MISKPLAGTHTMTVEAATYISQLDATHPTGLEAKSEGDDHIRVVKSALVTTLPNLAGPVTVTHSQLNTVPDRALRTGDTYTGTHDFTGATPMVATMPSSASGFEPASTEFVQRAMAGYAGSALGLVLGIYTGTAVTLVPGIHAALNSVATVTVTLPATPTAGATVAVTPMNGLYSNVIARNGEKIMGLSEDLTLDAPNATFTLRYIDSANGWRFI